MIPLIGPAVPTSRTELTEALGRGLGRLFELPPDREAVAAVGDAYPELEHLSLDVTEARLRRDIRPRLPGGQRHSGITASALRVVGRRLRLEDAAFDFDFHASGVRFDINHDQAEHYLDPIEAEQGHFQSHVGRSDLEAMLRAAAGEQVAKHGLTIEQVELSLRDGSSSPRDGGDGKPAARRVHAELLVTASSRMAFATLRAVIRGRGQVHVDEALNLAVRDLHFEGEGLAGKMAAALAHKHLQHFDGWTFPLASLSLGRLRLRDLRLGCRDGLQVEARLGS